LLNSMTVCVFLFSTHFIRQSVQPSHFVEWLNYATGYDMSLSEFLKTGERIFNLKRLFNIRRGITSKDDTLPPRILKQMRRSGGTIDDSSPLAEMLAEYYSYRGWDRDGKPNAGKLIELGLAGKSRP
ncbi:aldehyde ferredoxin oxidoreductase C-terminal domain-containing protein, partial [Thermodesulfobacteriota bacterium]